MILYDQNYNFIGISSETLSYLGYEDVEDFTSQHSDFANLLVNKEGYIYKFQNFSWIDFILYSGSPNKSALLQLKSGEQIEIKLSVKEVHLTTNINGSEKYYGVRIISENFVNIASKTDASIVEKSPAKNSFSLDTLMSADNVLEENTPAETMPETEEVESENDFVLNFPSKESVKEESSFSLDLREEKDEVEVKESAPIDFKLDIQETPFMQDITSQEVSYQEKEVENESLNFLKREEDSSLTPAKVELDSEDKEQGFSLDFLKKETALEEETPSSDKSTTEFILECKEETTQEKKDDDFSLNFLKKSFVEESTEQLSTDVPSTKEEDFILKIDEESSSKEEMYDNNKEQIIAQIQQDIAEIDAVEESSNDIFSTQESETLDSYLFTKNEVKKEKKSFTKTLKSLFSESEELAFEEESTHIQEPDAILKKNDSDEKNRITADTLHIQERIATLTPLGLDKEEEDELLAEFIHDTKVNIALFKEYINSNNMDQAEYSLIKMQSSANILNLNDIIITLANIKQSCTSHDRHNLDDLLKILDNQVQSLESHIENATV